MGRITTTSLRVFMLAAGFITPFQCCAQFTCPGNHHLVRTAPAYTQSAYAEACADAKGVLDGPYREMFDGSHPAAIGQLTSKEADGKWLFFYLNGNKMSEGSYRSGKRDGRWTSYYENGNKLSQGSYRDDTLEGQWLTWYDNGVQKSEGSYQAGEEVGYWSNWFPNGQLESAGQYQGRRIEPSRNASVPAQSGKWIFWYQTGRKRLEGCFEQGQQVGIWTEWAEEGQVNKRKMKDPDRVCR